VGLCCIRVGANPAVYGLEQTLLLLWVCAVYGLEQTLLLLWVCAVYGLEQTLLCHC
jgi:hypothetical protein